MLQFATGAAAGITAASLGGALVNPPPRLAGHRRHRHRRVGHRSRPLNLNHLENTMSTTDQTAEVASTGVAAEELKQFIERIERLEEDKAAITGDIKEVFLELKGRGFDVKAVRTLLKLRNKDTSERQEEEAILELYMQAMGMA